MNEGPVGIHMCNVRAMKGEEQGSMGVAYGGDVIWFRRSREMFLVKTF